VEKAISSAPQYQGAAGRSSLLQGQHQPEHRVDVNTRIDSTYATDAGVPVKGRAPGAPVRSPIKQSRVGNPHAHPELFSKAGVSGWMNHERDLGSGPGRDELWRPYHNGGKFFYSG